MGRHALSRFMLLTLTSGCATASDSGPQAQRYEQQPRQISAKPGNYCCATWLPDGWIVVQYSPYFNPSQLDEQIWRIRADGSQFGPISLPNDPTCLHTTYHYPSALPDGRLGLVQSCDPFPRRLDLFRTHLVGYDMATGHLTRLMATGVERFNAGWVTWSPSMTRAMIEQIGGDCDSMTWLTPTGIVPSGIKVTIGGKNLRTDQAFRHETGGSQQCAHADSPTWSPDGRQIAFLGSPAKRDAGGFPAAAGPADLYVMDPYQPTPRKVLSGIDDAGGLLWSPNGKWLAFSGTLSRGTGTWLFNPQTHMLLRASSRTLVPQGWAPTGQTIVSTTQRDPAGDYVPSDRVIVILDVPSKASGAMTSAPATFALPPVDPAAAATVASSISSHPVVVDAAFSGGISGRFVGSDSDYCYIEDGWFAFAFTGRVDGQPWHLLLNGRLKAMPGDSAVAALEVAELKHNHDAWTAFPNGPGAVNVTITSIDSPRGSFRAKQLQPFGVDGRSVEVNGSFSCMSNE